MKTYAKKFFYYWMVALAAALGTMTLGAFWGFYLFGVEIFFWLREQGAVLVVVALVASAGAANELSFRSLTKNVDKTGMR